MRTLGDWKIGLDQSLTLSPGCHFWIYRELVDRIEYVESMHIDGTTVVKEHTGDATLVDGRGLYVPAGVLDAIAEKVKPGATEREVALLKEALAYERNRVDLLLGGRQA